MSPVPAAKRFRVLWRVDGATCYETVTAEGSELRILHSGRPEMRSFYVGVCFGCAFPDRPGAGCLWPDCPRRNSKVEEKNVEPVTASETLYRPQGQAVESVQGSEAPGPVVESRSRWEREAAWGPGPGATW